MLRAMLLGLVVWPSFSALDVYMCFLATPHAPYAPFVVYRIVGEALIFAAYLSCRKPGRSLAFMDAFPRMRHVLLTSPYRDEVQVPVNPETMEPLPAHE